MCENPKKFRLRRAGSKYSKITSLDDIIVTYSVVYSVISAAGEKFSGFLSFSALYPPCFAPFLNKGGGKEPRITSDRV